MKEKKNDAPVRVQEVVINKNVPETKFKGWDGMNI